MRCIWQESEGTRDPSVETRVNYGDPRSRSHGTHWRTGVGGRLSFDSEPVFTSTAPSLHRCIDVGFVQKTSVYRRWIRGASRRESKRTWSGSSKLGYFFFLTFTEREFVSCSVEVGLCRLRTFLRRTHDEYSTNSQPFS